MKQWRQPLSGVFWRPHTFQSIRRGFKQKSMTSSVMSGQFHGMTDSECHSHRRSSVKYSAGSLPFPLIFIEGKLILSTKFKYNPLKICFQSYGGHNSFGLLHTKRHYNFGQFLGRSLRPQNMEEPTSIWPYTFSLTWRQITDKHRIYYALLYR